MSQLLGTKALSLILGHSQRGLLLGSQLNFFAKYTDNAASPKTKKYNKPPPIDLNTVRVNTSTSAHSSNTNDDKQNTNKTAAYALLSIPLATFLLGAWQIKRREKKIALIKFLESRTTATPVDMPTDPKVLAKLVESDEYRPFRFKGHFLHSKEIIMMPRSDLTGELSFTGGWVITPFVVSNNPNLIVLVNRGFVPYTHFSPMKRTHAQIDGEVEITGLLRSPMEVTNAFTPDNKPPNEWHYRDVVKMAQTLGTAPIYLDATRDTESSSIRGGPLGGQTAINIRNEHMSYIVTWFTLSVLTSALWWKRFGRVLF